MSSSSFLIAKEKYSVSLIRGCARHVIASWTLQEHRAAWNAIHALEHTNSQKNLFKCATQEAVNQLYNSAVECARLMWDTPSVATTDALDACPSELEAAADTGRLTAGASDHLSQLLRVDQPAFQAAMSNVRSGGEIDVEMLSDLRQTLRCTRLYECAAAGAGSPQ